MNINKKTEDTRRREHPSISEEIATDHIFWVPTATESHRLMLLLHVAASLFWGPLWDGAMFACAAWLIGL
ncbi:GL25657 [Drosophila persimilis]|uniref:GL25657 n=1 Tax=Drosophila persimilis TaxID=7234 RepID=B4GKN2_DROPE|nr:GL25657 [Drosophila persimilis]